MIKNNAQFDVIILGGGVAGLWLLNRLRQQHYQAIILDTHHLGAGQSCAAQGIVHGGLKYSLQGNLSTSAQAIADMPQRWKDCLQGQGEIDLSQVQQLSEKQYLFSTQQLSSKLLTFFAGKTLKARIQIVERNAYPKALDNKAFQGNVYQLPEPVLNMQSLLRHLSQPQKPFIYQVDEYNIEQGNSQQIVITQKDKCYTLTAKKIILCAGKNNQTLLQQFIATKKQYMQLRPLQMPMLWSKDLPVFYAHCLGKGINPRMTITSHYREDAIVWYLGGEIAEQGVNIPKNQQIEKAQQALQAIFPWRDFSSMQWRTLFVERAEEKQLLHTRPSTASLLVIEHLYLAWPTKMAMAPLLADRIIEQLQKDDINPGNKVQPLVLDSVSVASLPWE